MADGPLQEIAAKRSKVTRLGQGFAEGRLQDDPMERTIAAMREQLDWLLSGLEIEQPKALRLAQ